MQIAAGMLFSVIAVKLVEGAYPRERKIFGWHPLNPAPSAASIAAATAAATGVPAAAAALLPKQKEPPQGVHHSRYPGIVTADTSQMLTSTVSSSK